MKKNFLSAMSVITSLLVVLTMSGSMVCVAAEGSIKQVEIAVPYDDNGIPHPLDTITAVVTFNGVEEDVVYQWYESTVQDGEYTEISGATGKNYIVTWNDEGKYFKVSAQNVNNSEDKVTSEATEQVPDVTYGPVSASGTPGDTGENTPAENIFSVKGNSKKFILLNTENNDESKFFILTRDFYGQHLFSTDTKTQKFDVTKEGNIGYYLNNEFYNGANALPEDLKPYINMNHIWYTEAGSMGTDCTVDYTTGPQIIDGVTYPSGIALMSIHEYKKYAGKFGYKDSLSAGNKNWDGWILRSGRKTTWAETGKIAAVLVNDPTTPGKIGTQDLNYGQSWVRPVFYLSRDFFKRVPVDLETLGDSVKSAIRNTYSRDELTDIYSERELIEVLGYDVDYAITDISYNEAGTSEPLKTLEGVTGVDAHIDFCNNTDGAAEATAIIAVYDIDRKLVDCGFKKFTAEIGTTSDITVSTKWAEAADDNYSVEVYIWNRFADMLPLCPKKVFGE